MEHVLCIKFILMKLNIDCLYSRDCATPAVKDISCVTTCPHCCAFKFQTGSINCLSGKSLTLISRGLGNCLPVKEIGIALIPEKTFVEITVYMKKYNVIHIDRLLRW